MTAETRVKPLNVAVIGCGMLAAGTHIPHSAMNPQLNLHTLCDVNESAARRLADQYGATHVTTDFMDVLKNPAIDMTVLATTHTLRGEFIEAAARHGKPVYTEKPMSSSPAETARILKAVRESGIPFCVGHNRRSSPAILDAVEILNRHRKNPASGPWRLDRNTHLRPPMPEEKQTMVLIRINDDVLSWKPWAFEDGAILNEMTHFIDLANLFMGDLEPVQVAVLGSARMNFTILVQYNDGSIATLAHSASGTLDYPKELFEITHNGGMIAIDHMMEIRVMGIPNEPFRRVYPTQDTRSRTAKPGIEGFYESAQQTIEERLRTGETNLFIGGPNKGHYAHLDRFASCIRGEGESPCGVMDGAKATMLTLKAAESCRLGLPLRFGNEEWNILSLREKA